MKEISNEKFLEETGKDRKGWHRILKAAEKDVPWPHKTIARYLLEKHNLSPWWAQTVTGEYEKLTQRRITGQTLSGTFQIGVTKTFPLEIEKAWERILTGAPQWLGNELPKNTGETFSTKDGTCGILKVFKEYSHMRLTWQPRNWKKPSTLQVRVVPKKDNKTAVTFHQENLPNQKSLKQMRDHWKKILETFPEA